jgi:hypothetical protein
MEQAHSEITGAAATTAAAILDWMLITLPYRPSLRSVTVYVSHDKEDGSSVAFRGLSFAATAHHGMHDVA